MTKGILKRHESSEAVEGTPDSTSKHVKWDEEKLKESEAIKITIPKGQINEPKTPFQHGQYGSSCDESGDVFTLKNEIGNEEDDFTDSSSSEQFQNYNTNSNNYSNVLTDSSNWESSVSEFEDSEGPLMTAEKRENQFKSMRAQHYFMKQALMRGKELIETETEDED